LRSYFCELIESQKYSKRLVSNVPTWQVSSTNQSVLELSPPQAEPVRRTTRQASLPRRLSGTSEKRRTKLRHEAELEQLERRIKKKTVKDKDPLLERLMDYNCHLSSKVDNMLTEKCLQK